MLYLQLGEVYLRLERPDQAIEALRYARHIDPSNWDSCFKLAEAQLAAAHWEEACVGLIGCLIMEPNKMQPWPLLENVYQQINTSQVPPIQMEQGVRRLNPENPLVFDHFGRAYQDLYRTARQGRHLQTAEDIRHAAMRVGLPSDWFAPVATDEPEPPEPVFYVRGQPLPDPPRELPSLGEGH
jgi:tetratricopeptide (TPR) repeat protein